MIEEEYSLKKSALISGISFILFIISSLILSLGISIYISINTSPEEITLIVQNHVRTVLILISISAVISSFPSLGYTYNINKNNKKVNIVIIKDILNLIKNGSKEFMILLLSITPIIISSYITYSVLRMDTYPEFKFISIVILSTSIYLMPAINTVLRYEYRNNIASKIYKFSISREYFRSYKKSLKVIIKYSFLFFLSLVFPLLLYIIICVFHNRYFTFWSDKYKEFQ